MNFYDTYGKEIFKKYTDDILVRDVEHYLYEKGRLSKFFRNFYAEEMYRCCARNGYTQKGFPNIRTPLQALHDDSFMDFVLKYIKKHESFFSESPDIPTRVRRFFSHSLPRAVSNFPVREAKRIIFSFFPDALFEPINVHDASSGFGSRMSAVLLNRSNYYGTDPNQNLQECYDSSYDFLKKYFPIGSKDIRCLGSEVYIKEWEGKMDISFTSPPYFDLEVYSEDSFSSTKNLGNYQKWKEEYMEPTTLNIKKYLKPSGYALINTKNLKKYNVFDDFVSCFLDLGLRRLEDMQLEHVIKKYTGNKKLLEKENIMVFQKS